jgi:thiamine biosynthesis lipoprotein
MVTRRDFLSGKAIHEAGADPGAAEEPFVALADTVRLGTAAMASDFEVVMNAGAGARLDAASRALEVVNRLEDQLSIYRAHSELSQLNAHAAVGPVPVERSLFEVLRRAVDLSVDTAGAFDPTAGSLVALWRTCRKEKRLPKESEIAAARAAIGCRHVLFDAEQTSIRYTQAGTTLNVNAMGKGYALDRAADELRSEVVDWLMHGGYSSILAQGAHTGCDGWPVSIRHPLYPDRTLATLLLKNRGMSTSGSAVQFFRVEGRRYGHIIDPRTGWPVDTMLSTTVLAPDAALAEALSTAFFVLGVEKAREYCHNHEEVSALLVPAPASGSRLEPVVCGIPDSDLIFIPDR